MRKVENNSRWVSFLTSLSIALVVGSFFGCSHWPFKSENQSLQMVVADYYAEFYAFYPHLAKDTGLAQVMKNMPSYSKTNLANRVSDLKGFKTRVEKIRGESLGKQEAVDAEILSHRISEEIFEIENLHVFNQDPAFYFDIVQELLQMNFESANATLVQSEVGNPEQLTSEFLRRVQTLPIFWAEMQRNIESISKDTVDADLLQLQSLRDLLIKKQFSYFEMLLKKYKSDPKLRSTLNTQRLVTDENFKKLAMWIKVKAGSKKLILRKDDLQKMFYYQEFYEGDLSDVARGAKLAIDKQLRSKLAAEKAEHEKLLAEEKKRKGKKESSQSSSKNSAKENSKKNTPEKSIAKSPGRTAERELVSQNIEGDISRYFIELTKWMEDHQWVSVYSSEPPEMTRMATSTEVMGTPIIFVRQLPLQKEKVKDRVLIAKDAGRLSLSLLKEFVIQNLYPGEWLLQQTPQASSSKVRMLNRAESYYGGWALFALAELGQSDELWPEDRVFHENSRLQTLRSTCRLYTGLEMHLGQMSAQQAREFLHRTCEVSVEQAKFEVGRLLAQPQLLAADFGFYIFETWQAERQEAEQEKFQKRKFTNGILKNQGLPPILIKRESL